MGLNRVQTTIAVVLIFLIGITFFAVGPTTAQSGNGADTSSVPTAHDFRTSDSNQDTLNGSADVVFDSENDQVVVSGTIIGSFGCADANLESARSHATNDTLAVTVGTHSVAGERVGCTDARQPIDYTATFFVEEQPGRVKVVHAPSGIVQYTTTETQGPEESPGPLSEEMNPPMDLDDDGLYEDVNGDSNMNYNDIIIFFQYFNADAVQENSGVFDFSQNGQVSYNDVVQLFQSV